MVFAENDYMVETLAADGTDQSLEVCILPGTPRRRDDFRDLHYRHSQPKLFAIDPVTISKQEARGGLVRESLDDPLRSPSGRRMLCHVEVQYATPVVRQHDEHIQPAAFEFASGWRVVALRQGSQEPHCIAR